MSNIKAPRNTPARPSIIRIYSLRSRKYSGPPGGVGRQRALQRNFLLGGSSPPAEGSVHVHLGQLDLDVDIVVAWDFAAEEEIAQHGDGDDQGADHEGEAGDGAARLGISHGCPAPNC